MHEREGPTGVQSLAPTPAKRSDRRSVSIASPQAGRGPPGEGHIFDAAAIITRMGEDAVRRLRSR